MNVGYKLKGDREPNVWSLNKANRRNLSTDQQGSDQNYGAIQDHINAPALRNNAIQQFDIHKVLSCKENHTARVVLRPQPESDTQGMYPKPGTFRHEAVGMAYLSQKPNFGPIMPLASSQFPDELSTLGNLPG